jgi:hypothetical protein
VGFVKVLAVVVLLGTPLMVVSALPRLFELAGSAPASGGSTSAATSNTAFRLVDASPTNVRARFAPVDDGPPPTLAPPPATATPIATPRPTGTGERIIIGNTGGIGAVLRAEPVTGRPVGSLREGLILEVLERRSVPGSGNWVHVRTPEGAEGWVIGLVALPAPPRNP